MARASAGVVLLAVVAASVPVFGQAAPELVSVTPADGVTGVTTNSTIVFVFDQDMNVAVSPLALAGNGGSLVGNFALTPAFSMIGIWGADKRTLTFQATPGLPGFPYDTDISWTLNPPGNTLFPPITSAAGQPLATTSGRFHTAPYTPPPPLQLVSVTPANGTGGVATNSTIQFVFNQDMNVGVFPQFSSGAAVGNATLNPAIPVSGSWGADKRTLTFKASSGFPYDTNISWTLNPPGAAIWIPQFASAAGEVLATVSGSFHTAPYIPPPPVPKIVSVTPTNNATQVSLVSAVVFVFDQDMDTSVPLQPTSSSSGTGNYSFSVSQSIAFAGEWGADRRTLTFKPSAQLPLNTQITWVLNPAGTTLPLKSAAGQVLASVSGNYQTIPDTGGNPAEICAGTRSTLPIFALTRTFTYEQTSATETSEYPPTFGASFEIPYSGSSKIAEFPQSQVPALAAVALTLPSDQTVQLTKGRSQDFVFSDTAPSEAALEAAYPPGDYTFHFVQADLTEATNTIAVPADLPNVPTVANYDEAQSIKPAQDFTLRWNAMAPQDPRSFIRLLITDQTGKLIFQAPNDCVNRPLAASDTQVVIPANYLREGLNYVGTLEFGLRFYNATNDLGGGQILGTGTTVKSTSFNLGTLGGIPVGSGTTNQAARFTSMLLNSDRLQLTLNILGSPLKTYSIQTSPSLTSPVWTEVNQIATDVSGTAAVIVPVVRVPSRRDPQPIAFFRVATVGGL